jgi:hypothetical protein
VFRWNEAGEPHERPSRREASEVAHLGGDGECRQRVDAAKRAKASDSITERRACRCFAELPVDVVELDGPHVEGGQQMIEGELGIRVVEALRTHPESITTRPSSTVVGTATVVTQEEGLDAVLHASPVVLEVFAQANEITKRFLLGCWDADGREFAGAMQAREVASVEAIGLHAFAGSLRNQARCDHVARDVQ